MKGLFRFFVRLVVLQAVIVLPFAVMRAALAGAGLNRAAATDNILRLASIGDGLVLKSEADAFEGGAIAWVAGGVVLDLRQAKLAAGGAELNLVTIMGGCAITVPPDWPVELDARSFMGGSQAPAQVDATGPALRIKATTALGGLDVVRKPL
jgi:hypothetical protein